MGPPRTHPMSFNVEARPRERYLAWLASRPSIGELIKAFERKSWRDDQIICPAVYWALERQDLDRLYLAIARRITMEPGRKYRTPDQTIVYRSNGERFWAELPT